MIKYRESTDISVRLMILLGELLVVDGLLAVMFFAFFYSEGGFLPHFKRVTVLLSIIYAFCHLHTGVSVHKRITTSEDIFFRVLINNFWYIAVSFFVLWTLHWPLVSVQFMVPYYLGVIVCTIFYRFVIRQCIKAYRANPDHHRKALFVGPTDTIYGLFNQMAKDPTVGYDVLGYFAVEENVDASARAPYLGTPDDVIAYLDEHHEEVEELYCTLSTEYNDFINKLLPYCENHIIRFYSIPTNFNYTKRTMSMQMVAGLPVFSLHDEPLAQLSNRILKRSFDFICSSLFLLFGFPFVYIIFGTWIKLSSPGPIFFKQKRSGLNGKEFYCYKFRSMRVNADADKLQATKDDPRKTRVGEFMRRTNIDELPQFINVWKGEMSMVGPRPHMLAHTDMYSHIINNYMLRHFVKPGITGYAQVTGFRGETSELWQMEGRVKKDIWYIEHWSFPLDIWIMIKTFTNTLGGEKEAY